MTASAPPLVITDAAGRKWRAGQLSAEQIAELMPDCRLLAAKYWDNAALAAWRRLVLALFGSNHPELTPAMVHEVFRYGDIVPIAREFQRQAMMAKPAAGRA